ncbi:hypothetical protein HK101_006320 [Irineochytrium annulatum]|nr:hypothetical protein HK101_006320 [Irineochytrium annulatum]
MNSVRAPAATNPVSPSAPSAARRAMDIDSDWRGPIAGQQQQQEQQQKPPPSSVKPIPLIIVYPPDEDGDEPSISFSPNEYITGLPNPDKSRVQSLLNATLQVFMSVPEVSEELPFASRNEVIREFVATVRYLQCDAKEVADPSRVNLSWWRDLAGLPPSGEGADLESADDPIQATREFERTVRCFLDNVLGSSRLGKRFISEKKIDLPPPPPAGSAAVRRLDGTFGSVMGGSEPALSDSRGQQGSRPPPAIAVRGVDAMEVDSAPGSTFDMMDTGNGGSQGNGLSAAVSKDMGGSATSLMALGESPHMLSMPLEDYMEGETVSVIPLLRRTFGHEPAPTFFFGKSTIAASWTSPAFAPGEITRPISQSAGNSISGSRGGMSSKAKGPTISFLKLPHLLVLSFKRPISKSTPSSFHRTTVELPMDLDLGFAMDPKAAKIASASTRDKGTFYKLHGFVTQTEGRFLSYTRVRAGAQWFKCEDEVVAEAELGSRVASKGVTMALYRLQEKRR